MSDNEFKAFFDKKGRLVLPNELAEEYGFIPGSEIRVKPSANRLQLRPPVTRLAKVYIERPVTATWSAGPAYVTVGTSRPGK